MKNRLKDLIYTKENIPVITDEEKKYLQEYYKVDIAQLSTLINKDLSNWNI